MKTNTNENNDNAESTCDAGGTCDLDQTSSKETTCDADSGPDQSECSHGACETQPSKLSGPGAKTLLISALVSLTGFLPGSNLVAEESGTTYSVAVAAGHSPQHSAAVSYRYIEIEGQKIFYREAGPKDAPTVLLLHGFPTSSHMFRNLIPQLADRYHVIAPDMVGYGQSSAPGVNEFEYSFDHMASIMDQFTEKVGVEEYSLYLMDYGAPVGFRMAAKHPERVQSLIIQNGNAYEEGLREFWTPLKAYWKDQSANNTDALRGLLTIDATKWQYTHGVRNEAAISPDNWMIDQRLLDREGNQDIQLAMFLSYGTNPPLYPSWQAYLRKHQPPTLIVWGKNDKIFPADGAHPYKRDLKNLEFHLLDTGHFALEEDGDKIARLMKSFLQRNITGSK